MLKTHALSLSLLLLVQSATRVAAHDGADSTSDSDLILGSPRGQMSHDASSLFERRQQRTCVTPGWVPCANANFCCLPGEICQPNNPKGGVRGWCCPSYGLQCNGRACCNPATAFCCGSTCCQQGYRCSNGQCVAPPPPTTSRPPSTPTFVPTLSVPTFSTPTSCPLNGRDLEGRQVANCPTPTNSQPPSRPTETRVPKATMTFDYQRLRAGKKKMSAAKQAKREQAVDQLFESMCKGLKARGESSESIFTFTDDKKVKANNRAKAGCTGSPCSTGTSGNSCDEFPFASTTDGGAGAVFSCILVMAQNIQGGVISSFKQRNSMQSGEHYKFVITGYNCDTMSPAADAAASFVTNNATASELLGTPGQEFSSLVKRDLVPGGAEDDELESFPPFTAEDVNNTIIHSVGDLPAGTYTINTRINQGTVSSLRVIDYLGDEYARANVVLGPSGQRSLTFTLAQDGVGLGFFMDTMLDAVNVSSTMHVGASNSASWTSRGLWPMALSVLGALFTAILWDVAL
ncbi:hypothetical protein LshimejAT787_0705570 [Lyophyllum shimeji]|uniref:Deoxyribonuclease NucA/NucB domain-containing protein n=1 Tax=Lyophyllum shimeji TaxID=47721 RepID=A0A9P3UP79_LYOSH|nr:hypothetical protein LshimejAT787_0705570 [Lyophyllum shimeji]